MTTRRTLVNLAAVAVASAVLLVYAFAQLLAGALFNPTYRLALEVPQSGGLIAGQQVTHNGVTIGKVDRVALVGDHVVATLAIQRGAKVPTNSSVVILRRTLVGEQGVDLRAKGTTQRFYQPGETLRADHVQLPVDIQQLVQRANDVLGPVKPDSAATTVHELAEAVRGRRDELRSILVDAADLSERVADHGTDYDRLFRASRVVNAELAEHRETLARLVTQTADTTDVLRRIRQDFEGLLDQAPPVLSTVDRVVGRSQANLSCALGRLGTAMTFLARSEQLDNAAGALRANQFFFVGFSIISPEDLDGRTWLRVQPVLHPQPAAQSYLPSKRPIPGIRPGGACTSAFGEGAPAAAQPGWHKTITEARLVPPAPTAAPTRGGRGLPSLLGMAVLALTGHRLSARSLPSVPGVPDQPSVPGVPDQRGAAATRSKDRDRADHC
ncbi:MAG: MlaD family protein [Egibacteraceae bacterium]